MHVAQRGLGRRATRADPEDRDTVGRVVVEQRSRGTRAVRTRTASAGSPSARRVRNPRAGASHDEQAVDGVAGEDIERGIARGARLRPPVGGHAGAQHPADAAEPGGTHRGGQPPDLLPPHLEVAGPALVVRCVEHEVDAVRAELFDREQGQAG